MPSGNGTGPTGQGQGEGEGRVGGTRPGAGPGGYCLCPHCSKRVPHQQGKPCNSVICPQCGSQMMRE